MVPSDHRSPEERSTESEIQDFFNRVTGEIQDKCETAGRKYSFDFVEGRPLDVPNPRYHWDSPSPSPSPEPISLRLTLASLTTASTSDLPDLSSVLGKMSIQLEAERQPLGDSDLTEDLE